jgi:hypothetical protein
MHTGIFITLLYVDPHLLQVSCACSNGFFSGYAEVYADHGALVQLADVLTGFPASIADSREYEFGSVEQNHPGGGVHMRFRCLDLAGHAAVEIKIRGFGNKQFGNIDFAAFRIPIEAAAIDIFVEQLQHMGETVGATAWLNQAR